MAKLYYVMDVFLRFLCKCVYSNCVFVNLIGPQKQTLFSVRLCTGSSKTSVQWPLSINYYGLKQFRPSVISVQWTSLCRLRRNGHHLCSRQVWRYNVTIDPVLNCENWQFMLHFLDRHCQRGLDVRAGFGAMRVAVVVYGNKAAVEISLADIGNLRDIVGPTVTRCQFTLSAQHLNLWNSSSPVLRTHIKGGKLYEYLATWLLPLLFGDATRNHHHVCH